MESLKARYSIKDKGKLRAEVWYEVDGLVCCVYYGVSVDDCKRWLFLTRAVRI